MSNRGGDWSDAAASQGKPRTVSTPQKLEKTTKDPPLEPSEGDLNTLSQTSGLQNLRP